MKPASKIIVMALLLLCTISVNALANIVPFNGVTTGDVANSFDILFFPANYVFSIWTLIYFGLVVLVVYVWNQRNSAMQLINSLWGPFSVAALANGSWIVLWHYGYILATTIAMIVLLVCLLLMKRVLLTAHAKKPLSVGKRWCVDVPVSIYLGWISVATIANVAISLTEIGWNQWGLSAQLWSIIMMCVAGVLAIVMSAKYKDIAFSAVIIWALIGITVRYPNESSMITAAYIISGCIAVCVAITAFQLRSASKKPA